MGNTWDTYGSDKPRNYGGQWRDTIELLRLMQSDYQGARRQLEQVSHNLAEREDLVSQHLQYAFLTSRSYHTLCLEKPGPGTSLNQMGGTILGEAVRPPALPKLVRLEMRCLGKFEVRSVHRQFERWHSVKAKSALQYLLIRPREPVVKEAIMEALWPNHIPRAASNNLKAAIHSLRLTLNSLLDGQETMPVVLFVQGSYLLNPEIELWLDVEEFEHRWVLGRRLEKEGKPAEAMQEFEKAERLYRGDYLEDEPYEEWTLLRREALKDNYLLLLGKLADASSRNTDYESCILYCQKILGKDRCREDAYRRLMYCYAKLGQRNRSLRWYEICRQTIRTELDAEPGKETTVLYNRILNNQPI